MRKLLIPTLFAAIVLTGCSNLEPRTTDAMVVKQMAVNGTRLAYVEEGSGTTALFVHGASGDWRSWEALRPFMSPRFRFVSLSRRYHHPNAWDDDGAGYTFDQHVEDIAAFIRAMNVGKVHLIGNSYGGRLVGYVALKYPDLIRSAVLGEASLAAPNFAEGKAALAAFGKDLGQSAAAAKAGDDRQSAILLANAVLADPDGFGKLTPLRQQRWLDNAKTMKPMYGGRTPAPVTCDQLKALKVPALVVRGEKTRDSYRYGHDAMLACLPPGTAAAIVPGGTHMWAADNPEGAAAAILPFLSRL